MAKILRTSLLFLVSTTAAFALNARRDVFRSGVQISCWLDDDALATSIPNDPEKKAEVAFSKCGHFAWSGDFGGRTYRHVGYMEGHDNPRIGWRWYPFFCTQEKEAKKIVRQYCFPLGDY